MAHLNLPTQDNAVGAAVVTVWYGSGIITASYLMHDVAGLITTMKADRPWCSKLALYKERIIGVGAGFVFGFMSGGMYGLKLGIEAGFRIRDLMPMAAYACGFRL